jgi:hypothetical protein
MSKRDLMRIMKLFMQDENRGISLVMFSELAGVHIDHLRDVFLRDEAPLTEYVQRRVSRAYQDWLRGDVAIMQNRDRTKYVEYRKESRPRMSRSTRLQVVNGEIKIKTGIRNRSDYSSLTLDEVLGRK